MLARELLARGRERLRGNVDARRQRGQIGRMILAEPRQQPARRGAQVDAGARGDAHHELLRALAAVEAADHG